MKHHYVYRVTNTRTGEYYIGKRTTNRPPSEDHRYMGGGNRIRAAVYKYGAGDFHKTVLAVCETDEAACVLEAKLVTQEQLNDPLCLNLCLGGGNRSGYRLTSTQKERLSEAHLRLKKTISPEQREQTRIANVGNQNAKGNKSRLGRPHTKASRKKMSVAMRGNTNGAKKR